jgi:hypothetical protein
MSPRDIIKQDGFAIGIGESKNVDCPFCEGGDNNDRNTCRIYRDSTVVVFYRCYRAKCGSRGRVNSNGSGHSEQSARAFKPNPYPKKVKELSLEEMAVISDKWQIDIVDIASAHWYLALEERAWLPLLMPVYSPKGGLRGHILRLQQEDGSKTFQSFKLVDETWMAWYPSASGDIVVVEDQISAKKAAEYCGAVAVLGTEISPEKFEEILNVARGRRIWIALDRDAVKKGFDYLRRYRLYCDNLYLLLLPKDIKNMTHSELVKLGGPFKI